MKLVVEVLLETVTALPEVCDCATNRELIPESPARVQAGHHFFSDHTFFPDSVHAWNDNPV